MRWGVLMVVAVGLVPSAYAKKKDFEFGGRLGLGIQRDYRGEPEKRFEMRLQAESPRTDGWKGVVEVRGDEDTRTVSMNEVFGDYRNDEKTHRIRFGRGKKILGWQWEYPTSTRLTINRTMPYRYLSEQALTGRDYFVSSVWLIKDEEKETDGENPNVDVATLTDTNYFNPEKLIAPNQQWKYEVSAHFNESDDIALIFNAIRTLSPQWRVGAWLLTQRTRSVIEVFGVWEVTLSALFQSGIHRAQWELFSGVDPFRTEVNRLYGNQKMVNFGSARFEYGVYLNHWNPYGAIAGLLSDLSQKRDRQYEGVVGLRFFVTPRFNIAGEGLLNTHLSTYDETSPDYHEIAARVLARIFF